MKRKLIHLAMGGALAATMATMVFGKGNNQQMQARACGQQQKTQFVQINQRSSNSQSDQLKSTQQDEQYRIAAEESQNGS